MKISIFILAVILFSSSMKAQQNIFKNKPWEDFKRKELLNQKLKLLSPAINNNNFSQLSVRRSYGESVLKIPLTKTFIKHTENGTDLYVINSYKMPCLVPDKTFVSNMPVAGYDKSQTGALLLKDDNEK